MANLLNGLESLGLGNLSKIDVYSENDGAEKKEEKAEIEKKEAPQINEADFLFDKTHKCPCCDKEFKAKTVKTGKAKMDSADTDLRPKYQGIDPLKYDAIVCPFCGYAALNKYFDSLMLPQAKLIKEQITKSFTGLAEKGEILTYDEAITRHKLALVNTVVKRGKISERAYVCLKTAWLLRGKRETLSKDTKNYAQTVSELYKEEKDFLLKACEGFMESFSKEVFPICGMDEHTATYLVADLCRQVGKTEEASRWISRVITSRTANERIKNKAREIKELIVADQSKADQNK